MPTRWHQFNRVGSDPIFGEGTERQAQQYVTMRNAHLVGNRYELTTLEEDEKPKNDALVVDLETGEIQPERYKQPASHGE